MEFRHNLTVSFILHAVILTAAVTVVAGRDAVKRIPFTPIYIEFATESSAPPSHISSIPKRELFPKATVISPLPDAPIASSQHPVKASRQMETKVASVPGVVTNKNSDVAPDEKKADGNQERMRGFNFIDNGQRSGDPTVTSMVGHAETQSSVRSVTGTVEGKGHANAVAAIRTAIERAKYYPLTAKRRGIEGTATVEFAINDDGMPGNINIATSSGSDILDNAALTTITRAAPFPHDIRTIRVPISFRLEKD
jgi:protein TonB